MRRVLSTLLLVVGFVAWVWMGLLIIFFWFDSMILWLGSPLGPIVGIVLIPGVVVFPVIYWFVEGTFPLIYLGYFVGSLAGLITMNLAFKIAGGSEPDSASETKDSLL